jgi:hypothetical protein
MIDYLLADYNTPFLIAFSFVAAVMVLEVGSLLIGAGLSQIIDNLFDATDVGIGADSDADVEINDNFISKYIAWIKVKNVPLLILAVVYAASFSIIGYVGQSMLVRTIDNPAPTWVATMVAFVGAIPVYKMISEFLGAKMFKEVTTALSEKTFVGEIIEINTGTAKKGLPAEGKYKDQFGQLHYFMVEPENDTEQFEQGTKVQLTGYDQSIFKAIKID